MYVCFSACVYVCVYVCVLTPIVKHETQIYASLVFSNSYINFVIINTDFVFTVALTVPKNTVGGMFCFPLI